VIGFLTAIALWLMIARSRLDLHCWCGGRFKWHQDYGGYYCDQCGRQRPWAK
jgi:hypothetical protein